MQRLYKYFYKNFSFSFLFFFIFFSISFSVNGFYRYSIPPFKFEVLKKTDPKEKEFLSAIESKYQKDIKDIVGARRPIIRYIDFKMPVKKKIYTEVFERLDYAVTMIRKYVRTSSFSISNYLEENYYSAYDGYKTYAPVLKPVYTFKSDDKDRFVFYIEGFYDGSIYLEGKMIVDVTLLKLTNDEGNKTRIIIKNYVRLTSRLLQLIAPIAANTDKVNRMIENSIKVVIYQGVQASYRIINAGCNLSFYLKKRDHFLNKYVYREKD